ncbi:MAG: hypothetical protein J6S41_00560, partial [Clostridia bacterium]|nr:hypothetical protein [Clostridia bacterium]
PMGLPNHDGKLIDVICTALPDLSTRQWWDKLSMTFTSYEPYFYSDTEKTGACGSPITVEGTAKPLMQITRTLAAKSTNQSYGDGTHTMTFSEIPAGDLVIDLNRQTAAVGSSSIMPFYSYNSSFIFPRTGTYTITGTGTVKWRERWE